ncbi:MAG: iron donor protein CyaY [Planctomycetes bacterium]|nr:iron donor protein CyaY [Planctomycetota bacterium]
MVARSIAKRSTRSTSNCPQASGKPSGHSIQSCPPSRRNRWPAGSPPTPITGIAGSTRRSMPSRSKPAWRPSLEMSTAAIGRVASACCASSIVTAALACMRPCERWTTASHHAAAEAVRGSNTRSCAAVAVMSIAGRGSAASRGPCSGLARRGARTIGIRAPSAHAGAPMDRQSYRRLADQCLERVIRALEAFDPDLVDFSTSDGVVKIEFPGQPAYVLNRQEAATQMWFAAGARAWHYGWDESRKTWVDDRDGHELYANIARLLEAKLGHPVRV